MCSLVATDSQSDIYRAVCPHRDQTDRSQLLLHNKCPPMVPWSLVPGPRGPGEWPAQNSSPVPPAKLSVRGGPRTGGHFVIRNGWRSRDSHVLSRSVTQCHAGLQTPEGIWSAITCQILNAEYRLGRGKRGEGAEVVLGGPATAEGGIKTEQKYEANEVPSPAAPPGLNLHYHSSALLGGRPSKYFLIATSGCSNERV